MNLERIIEFLQEMGKVKFEDGDVKKTINELSKRGYKVRFDTSTDYLVLESRGGDGVEEVWTDYCPECNVAYCQGRYTTGQCE